MTVESATYISDLNTSYPAAGDARGEGDDHLRLLKSVLKATFPNVTAAVAPTHTELNLLDGVTGTLRSSTSGPLSGEFTLIGSGTVSGTPSTIDFVHGTGGVVIDSTYEEYLLLVHNIAPSSTADLRLQVSATTGASWGVSNFSQQYSTVAAGTASDADLTGNGYVRGVNMSSTNGVTGAFRVFRNATRTLVHGDLISNTAMLRTWAQVGTGSIDGLRLLWASGTFANQGTVKLYARKP